MYFIARNNKIYSYIASIKPLWRYFFTGIVFVGTMAIALYCFYYPLQLYSILLAQERDQLQKKYVECGQIEKLNKQFEQLIELAEKTIHNYAMLNDTYKGGLSFVIDATQKCGLILQSYNMAKEEDKDWYIKEMVHVTVEGTFDQCMRFIDYTKKSEHLISVFHVSIDCSMSMCKMHCDIARLAVKNPSTLGKLKG